MEFGGGLCFNWYMAWVGMELYSMGRDQWGLRFAGTNYLGSNLVQTAARYFKVGRNYAYCFSFLGVVSFSEHRRPLELVDDDVWSEANRQYFVFLALVFRLPIGGSCCYRYLRSNGSGELSSSRHLEEYF